MCHGPCFPMEPVNPVLPSEGPWLTGVASARAAEETGVQLDQVQIRLDELLRRLESQESLIRTLPATQVPLDEYVQETGWWTTETPQPEQQPNDDAWWHENDQWNGRGCRHRLEQLVLCVLEFPQRQANEQPLDCADENAKLFDDYEFDVLMCKKRI